MICTKCHSESPDGMLFCGQCGARLEKACPKCNFTNPPQFKFCGECGHKLAVSPEAKSTGLSFNEKLEKIQKYLPKDLTRKILAQKSTIEGERKQVTVMFCDMVGFTSLTERLGSEQMYALMGEVYEILIRKVFDYGGTVNELTGDGIMALFGAPIALEDAPQRAIRASLAVHQEMSKFSDRMKLEKGIPTLRMRIGIHTGLVIIGTMGNDLRVEFNALGDTVNLASRIEGTAEPGTTYVSEETFKLAEGFFMFEAMGQKKIKGKEKPVIVYQVIAASTRRTRFDVSTERGLTPFVGRERELELLIDGYERAKEGRGQAYSIMGEAGVGKSRLLYQFRKAVMNEDATFMEGRCLSYGKGAAYQPITELLKAHFEIHEDDGDDKIREKVVGGLKMLRLGEASILPYLLELLSVKESGMDRIPLSPEGKKERMIGTLRQIVLKIAEVRPLIMAVEDLHWVDSSTEDVLRYIMESIPGIRILLILTYRPEFVHTWGGRSYHNQVTLNRLSNRESLQIAAHLLRTGDIGRELEDLILSKSEGIPFFIEEFIKSLKDLRIIECTNGSFQITKDLKTVAIPSTIHDVIMARVDSLPQEAKEVLQTGSAIEREFGHDLIRKLMGLPEDELLSHISVLKDAELLYERGIYPHSTYIFKHTVTREVVYDSILNRKKVLLHEAIGNAIEETYKNNLEEYYGVLSGHYIASENYGKGAEYSRLACRKALRSVSRTDAHSHARNAVLCIEKLPQTGNWQQQWIDARTVLGLTLVMMTRHPEAKEAVAPVLEAAIKADSRKRLGQIYTILGIYYTFVEEDLTRAEDVLRKALELAREGIDYISELYATFWLSNCLCFQCNFTEAEIHYQRHYDICKDLRLPWSIAWVETVMAIFCFFFQGEFEKQHEISAETFRNAEETGDPQLKEAALIIRARYLYGKGMFDEAEKLFLKIFEFGEKSATDAWHPQAQYGLAETYFERGEYQKAREHYGKGVEIYVHNGLMTSFVHLLSIGILRSGVMSGEKNVDLDALYAHAHQNKLTILEGSIGRYVGEILLNIDDRHIPEAEQWILKAIETDEKYGMRFHMAQGHALYAELYKRKGDRQKARESLEKAVGIYRECGADGWAAKGEKELAAL